MWVAEPQDQIKTMNPVLSHGPSRKPLSKKRAARRKALPARLTDPVVVAEDPRALRNQTHQSYLAFKSSSAWQEWLTLETPSTMLRISRCARVERKLCDWASHSSIDFSEDDQKLAVEILALEIRTEPSLVVAGLRQTPSGCNLLITRRRSLAQNEPNSWLEDDRALASCLLGGNSEVDASTPRFAEARVSERGDFRQKVEEADAITRDLVEADPLDDSSPGLVRLCRYPRTLHRQLKWSVDPFHVESPDGWGDSRYKPASVDPVASAPKPEVVVRPKSDKTNPFSRNLGIGQTNPIEPRWSEPDLTEPVLGQPVIDNAHFYGTPRPND